MADFIAEWGKEHAVPQSITERVPCGDASDFGLIKLQVSSPPRHSQCKSRLGERIQQKYRILIVDDNKDHVLTLGQLIDLHGFATNVVTDSRDALRHAREFRPHFIMLDLAMPHLSGTELSKLIRQQPELANVPLISISGYADKDHAAIALQAGFDYHLTKPVEMKEFHRIVASEIEKRQPGLDGFFVKV